MSKLLWTISIVSAGTASESERLNRDCILMNLPLAPILALSLQGHRLNLKPSLLIWELHCPGAGRASVVKWINNREQLNQQAGKHTQLLLIWPWSWGGLDTVWNPHGVAREWSGVKCVRRWWWAPCLRKKWVTWDIGDCPQPPLLQ